MSFTSLPPSPIMTKQMAVVLLTVRRRHCDLASRARCCVFRLLGIVFPSNLDGPVGPQGGREAAVAAAVQL